MGKELVRIFYDRLWNQWECQLADELLADDILFRGSLGLTRIGRAGFLEYVEIIRTAFPDFHNTIEDLIAEGDKVVARLTYRGTHQGELFGQPPTGRKIEYAGVAIFTIKAGKIAEVWVLGDLYGLMRQIGGS